MILRLQIEKGLTLLFVTHDLGLAGKIADRAGVMLAGGLAETGPATRVLQNPAHPYTKSLIDGARGLLDIGAGHLSKGNANPQGCPFVHRCALAREICRREFPGPQNAGPGDHLVWCHHPLARS